jgi:hypothetical protein
MRHHILCLLTLLIVLCSISLYLQTEGFANICIDVPDISVYSGVYIIMITIPFAIIAFYAWNWNTLRTNTESQIIGRYVFSSKLHS